MRFVRFKIFGGAFKNREKLCEEAAEFASSLDEKALINVTATGDSVIVWYRSNQ
jgi:hypothetical protein